MRCAALILPCMHAMPVPERGFDRMTCHEPDFNWSFPLLSYLSAFLFEFEWYITYISYEWLKISKFFVVWRFWNSPTGGIEPLHHDDPCIHSRSSYQLCHLLMRVWRKNGYLQNHFKIDLSMIPKLQFSSLIKGYLDAKDQRKVMMGSMRTWSFLSPLKKCCAIDFWVNHLTHLICLILHVLV